MKNIFLTILFQFFFLLAIQAQEASFEGIIESVLQNTTGIEYQIKWYIKEGKIAYELSFETPDRGKFNMRLVPQIEKKTILMVTGDTKIEVPSSEISNAQSFDLSDLKLEKIAIEKTDEFKQVKSWKVSTDNLTSVMSVTTDVDINFADYKEFFKSDLGICALAESGQKGFPLNIETHDKEGNLIEKTTFKKVTRMEVEDTFFQ